MNVLQNDQKQGIKHPKNAAARIWTLNLLKMAKPIGNFGGPTDFILRIRDGEAVAADTGDQGGGQN